MAITILAMAARIRAMIVTFAHLISVASALPTDASALESAISALVNAITTLESRSEFWEKSLPWFTGLVVLGLVADVIVIVWERRDEGVAYRRWILQAFHPAERPSGRKFALELFASAAILLGVAGELWAGAEIASVNGQLRSKNAELRTASDRLVTLLNHNLEGEKVKRLQLAASLLDREFNDQSAARDKLRSLQPVPITFEYRDEKEPKHTAGLINFVFDALHWPTRRWHCHPIIRDGIRVSVSTIFPPLSSSLPSDPEAASKLIDEYMRSKTAKEKAASAVEKALLDSLKSEGMDAEPGNDAYDLPGGTVLISVGSKPNHALENAIRELGGRKQPTTQGLGTLLSGNVSEVRDDAPASECKSNSSPSSLVPQ